MGNPQGQAQCSRHTPVAAKKRREAACSICKEKIIVMTDKPTMCPLCSFHFRRASPYYEKTEKVRLAKLRRAAK